MSPLSHRPHGADRITTPALLRRSADINVTPLIDVLLVLLIIFLAAIPLTQQGLDADLPQQASSPPPAERTSHVVAEYTAGQLTINKQPVRIDDAEARFREIFAPRRDKTLYIVADGRVRYADVIRIIDLAKAGGVMRFGIVTEELRAIGSSARR